MAERRMFAKSIIDSDLFLDMPSTTQTLYFHLAMRADDDGFVNNPKKIVRMVNGSEDDFKLLIAKCFIIPFEIGVVVIRHWRIHNYIQKDRYNETMYKQELGSLKLENGVYTKCIQDVSKLETQVSIDKERLGKDSEGIDIDNYYQSTNLVIEYLNEKAGTKFKRKIRKTRELIKSRFKEGYIEEDFYTVIDKKISEWLNTDMAKYIRPETLFGSKFESYLNQKDSKPYDKNSIHKDYSDFENWGEQK